MMSRGKGRKRGKGRVYTNLDGSVQAHAAAGNAAVLKTGDAGKEIAGYTHDFLASPTVSGVIPNPDEIMMTIAPGRQTKLAVDPYALHQMMRRTNLKYKSLIQTRKNGVLSKEWRILPNPTDPDQDRAAMVAEFVKVAFDRMEDFHAALECLLDAIPLGFAVSEIIWEQREVRLSDGKVLQAWVPQEIIQRRQGRFGFAEDWSLRYQDQAGHYVEVPPGKFIVHSHRKENGSRYGTSEASECFWAYWMEHNFEKWWAIFGEKFGMPTAVATVPSSFTDEQKKKVKALLQAIQTEYGVVIPKGAEIKLLEAERTGSINTYRDFCEFCHKCMSEALTGQSLATGQGESGKGSYAQSQTHGEVKQEYVEADAKGLMATINSQAVPTIVSVNFGDDVPAPRFVIDFESKDLAGDLEMDDKLVNKIGLPLSKKYFYEKYGKPVPADDEELVDGQRSGKALVSEKPEADDGDEEDSPQKQEDAKERKGKKAKSDKEDHAREGTRAPRICFAVSDEAENEVRRREREAKRLADKLASAGAAEFAFLGEAIMDEIDAAHDLSDARERLQRMMADGLYANNIAQAMLKAKVNGYLFAAAQMQRYANEVLLEEAAEEASADLDDGKMAGRGILNRLASRGGHAGRVRPQGFAASDLLANYKPLEPKEALKWFEELVPLTKSELDNLPREAWGSSFTIGDFESREALREVQMLINDFLQNGKTKEDFVKAYQAKRKELGLDAAENHQAEQLFRTETARAYGAGRTRSLLDSDVKGAFPMWQYVAVLDDRTRDQHIALNGYVAPPDDTFWLTKNPPWDYNCRCDVIPLTKRQIEKLGIEFEPTVTMPDGSEVDPRGWATSPGFRGLGFAASSPFLMVKSDK